MAVPIIIAAAVAAVAGLVGQAIASGDKAKADELRQRALEQYGPDALAEIDRQSQVGPSAMEGYQADPQSMHYQRQALQRLAQDSSTVGLTPEERAELAGAMDEEAGYAAGERASVMDDARRRGVGGSGADLAAQLGATSSSAMRANKMATASAGNAARRRALANMQLGDMAGQFRGQGFEEFSRKASATDAINQFNAKNRQQNRLGFIDARTALMTGQASNAEDRADDTQSTWAGAGAATSQAASSYYDYYRNKKKEGER